jgi:phosphoesterase RecJ-like protein
MSERFPSHQLRAIKELLSNQKRIVITTHSRPDGDAMGSSLGLYNYLLEKDQQVQVITPTDYPQFLKWMPGNDFVINYENNAAQAKEFMDQAEILFCLDFNQLNRVEKMEELLKNFKGTRILIDHHPNPDRDFNYIFSYPEISLCLPMKTVAIITNWPI